MAARLAAVACVAIVTVTFAWPAPATGQGEQEEGLGGVYSVTIGEADVPPGLAGGPALVGQWTLTFNDDGTYTLARQDVGPVASGTFEVTGATLTFVDWSGVIGCGGTPDDLAGASYAWEAQGDDLRLTPIQETCAERRVLLGTRAFGGYEACTTEPLALLAGPPAPPAPPATPQAPTADDITVGGPPAATPVLGAQEGEPAGAQTEAAIDALLRQATGCWATGDPARFLALHSQQALDQIVATGPPGASLADFAEQLALFMTTPVSFERIGEVQLTDPTHASAYVEITFGGEAIPQLFTFVQEDGVWLFGSIFVLGPQQPAPPQP